MGMCLMNAFYKLYVCMFFYVECKLSDDIFFLVQSSTMRPKCPITVVGFHDTAEECINDACSRNDTAISWRTDDITSCYIFACQENFEYQETLYMQEVYLSDAIM